MNSDDHGLASRIGRRGFLTGCIALTASALLPGGRARAAAGVDGLRIQRLAWAGIRLPTRDRTVTSACPGSPSLSAKALTSCRVPLR